MRMPRKGGWTKTKICIGKDRQSKDKDKTKCKEVTKIWPETHCQISPIDQSKNKPQDLARQVCGLTTRW